MGRFLQTPRLSASTDPRKGEGVRKRSASTSPFLTGSPLLICPQLEMPAQESTTCRHPCPGLSGAGRLSRDLEVSSGLPLPSPQAKLGKPWLLPASLWGRRERGVPRRVWSALGQQPMGTSHCTAQPWSALHRLALGAQPRNNGAIQAAWALQQWPSWSLLVARRCVSENVGRGVAVGSGGNWRARQRQEKEY